MSKYKCNDNIKFTISMHNVVNDEGLKIRSQYKTDFKHLIKINYKVIESKYM